MAELTMSIGIDPGVKTGFCVYSNFDKRIFEIETYKIHEAFDYFLDLKARKALDYVTVYFEDARLRTWFGSSGREKLQGAGSVKRDSKIWEDFLKDLGVEYYAVAPRNNKTKVSASYFKTITGWEGRTSEHARDAAMLVYGK